MAILEECECESNTFFIEIKEYQKPIHVKEYIHICSECKKQHNKVIEVIE